jgi:hypothetical protein
MADWTTPSAIHSKCGEDSGHEAIYAIDENIATYYIHSTLHNHWIIFDMGETKKITQVRLYQVLHYPWGGNANVNVYVGDDPANLGDAVWTGNLGSTTGWHESGVFEKNGRYVKLAGTTNVSEQRIYEFDAMAEAVAGGPIERAVTESLGSISDVATQLLQRDRQISESSISASDGVSAEKFVPLVERNVSELTISIADSPVYTLRRDRSLSEPTITVSDGVIRVFWGYRMVSEPSISASDGVSAEKISGLVREVNEPTISVSDGIGYTVRHVVSVSEPTISVSDVVYAGIFGKVVKVKIFLIIGDLAIQLTGA